MSRRPNPLAAAVCGLLFGAGLILSGMVNPAKVLGFLDVFGAWDPSLALVMVGAIGVALPAFVWAERRSQRGEPALLGADTAWPTPRLIDRPLVLGSLIFGAGWGLAGLCPGPALAALVLSPHKAVLFVAAMVLGMRLVDRLTRRMPGGPR